MERISTFDDFISEGRTRYNSKYDKLANKLVKQNFKKWISDWKSGAKTSSFYEQIELDGLEFDLTSTLYFDKVDCTKIKGFEVFQTTGADGRDFYIDDEGDEVDQTPFIIIDFGINSEWIPGYWQDVYMNLSDCMRHEMEHITQDGVSIGNYRPGKPNEDDSFMRLLIKNGMMPEYHYQLLPKEVDANLQGLRYESKKRKESMSVTVNRYLNVKGYTEKENEEILSTWRQRAKKIGGIPKF